MIKLKRFLIENSLDRLRLIGRNTKSVSEPHRAEARTDVPMYTVFWFKKIHLSTYINK